MLEHSIAKDIIHEGLSQGADFCDIFVEKSNNQVISFSSSEVKNIQSGIDFGIGIRLFFGTNSLYAYTNSKEKEDLLSLTKKLASYYSKKNHTDNLHLDFTQPLIYKEVPFIHSDDYSLEYKISHLRKINQLARQKSNNISQVSLGLILKDTQVEIFNSEGLYAKEFRPYSRLSTIVTTTDGSKKADGSLLPGSRGGFKFIDELNLEELTGEVVRQSLCILNAKPAPAGKMPVIIDNGFGGVIFHEACGHLLETTSVEKKSSVLWNKKGEQIAHENLSAVDDGTLEYEWGSISIDDEGMPTQKTQLIKNGKLENFLCDRMGNLKTGHPRTASARKQNYRFSPASRMRNTFIECGNFSMDDMLQSVGDGLYAKKMGGGSVNPSTGEFNFNVQEGYIVKDGKIKQAVRGATLIGLGEEVLKKISMSGKNFALATGMCGSVSGSVPVTVGQPAIKVDEILVGGQA